MDPNSDRWSFSTVSVSIRKEDNCEYFCLFDLFHYGTHQILLTDMYTCCFISSIFNQINLSYCPCGLYCVFTALPSTTNVFAGLCESRQRPTGCSTWLLLNRGPTGSTVATLVLLSVTVPVIARGQLWPSLHRHSAHILSSFYTHKKPIQPGPFVSLQWLQNCRWTCTFLMSVDNAPCRYLLCIFCG